MEDSGRKCRGTRHHRKSNQTVSAASCGGGQRNLLYMLPRTRRSCGHVVKTTVNFNSSSSAFLQPRQEILCTLSTSMSSSSSAITHATDLVNDTKEDGESQSSSASSVQAIQSQWDPARVVRLTATSNASQRVLELEKSVKEYMALPASQYSVLDARKVDRTSEDTFVCYVGAVRFFQFTVEPVLELQVVVVEDGCEINLLSCRISGSAFVEAQNEKFTTTMNNRVRWRHCKDDDDSKIIRDQYKELVSEITLNVDMEVPKWFKRIVPMNVIEYTGSKLLQSILAGMVPQFLQQLQNDYSAWARGDTSRKPMG